MPKSTADLLTRHLVAFQTPKIPHRFTDILVVGSGIAGLSASLAASDDPKCNVLLLAKDALDETATRLGDGSA